MQDEELYNKTIIMKCHKIFLKQKKTKLKTKKYKYHNEYHINKIVFDVISIISNKIKYLTRSQFPDLQAKCKIV